MDDTGIPIVGSCLMDQSNYMFVRRSVINAERVKAKKEIEDAKPKKNNKQPQQPHQNAPRGTRIPTRQQTKAVTPQTKAAQKASRISSLKAISKSKPGK